MGADVALPLPEQQYLAAVVGHRAGSTKSLTKAAANPELVAAFSAALAGWCDSVEAALREAALEGKDAEDAGGCWGCWGCWRKGVMRMQFRTPVLLARCCHAPLPYRQAPRALACRRPRGGGGFLAQPRCAAGCHC